MSAKQDNGQHAFWIGLFWLGVGAFAYTYVVPPSAVHPAGFPFGGDAVSYASTPALRPAAVIPPDADVWHIVAVLQQQTDQWRIDHDGRLPDVERDGWSALTEHTGPDGRVFPGGQFGPYLSGVPVNPSNGLSTVAVTQVSLKRPVGFLFNPETGTWSVQSARLDSQPGD